tara:strand:+ start:4339 stop:5295 length:957 start_codon:yes stop_codon:yes gene_type:complete
MKKVLIEINKVSFIIVSLIIAEIAFINPYSKAIENKILVKIDNEIITSFDVENESKFLKVLNPKLKELDKKQIFEISKNSIIRQKIKKVEILKHRKNLDLEEEFINELIKTNYSRFEIKNLNDFEKFFQTFNVDIKNLKEKVIIQALWNNLIVFKYASKIKINKADLKNQILNNKNEITSYHLNEILFNISDSSKLNEKYKNIEKIIKDSNFENAALLHSESNSYNLGGDIGWIEETSLNKKIRNELKYLDIKNYTKPILTSNGFLILMIKDKKKVKKSFNFEEELEKLINLKTNEQFIQFSGILFKKASKNINVNEL